MDPRTPTYDQLSALCAQMAAALNAWMVFSNADDPAYKARWEVRGRVDTIAALAAYRTLSPEPQWRDPETMPADGYFLITNARGQVCACNSRAGHRVINNHVGISEHDWDTALPITGWMPCPKGNRARGEG